MLGTVVGAAGVLGPEVLSRLDPARGLDLAVIRAPRLRSPGSTKVPSSSVGCGRASPPAVCSTWSLRATGGTLETLRAKFGGPESPVSAATEVDQSVAPAGLAGQFLPA